MGREKIKFELDFHGTSCVELHDFYYITGGDNFHVISPEGKLVFTTSRPYEEAVFGYDVRIGRVFRNHSSIFFSYWAFDDDSISDGLIRHVLGKGLVGRIDYSIEKSI